MKWMVSLAWQSLKYRRRSSMILISAIAIATMFMIFIGLTGSSAIHMINEQNLDHYGEQMLIVTGMNSTEQNHIATDSDFKKMGEIQIAGSITYNQSSVPILVGAMDDAAVKTARIHMAEGRLPTKASEVALESSVMSQLGLQSQPKVNDMVTMNITSAEGNTQKTYRLVGVIDDYTVYWNKQYTDFQSRLNGDFFTPPSVMITSEDAQALYTQPSGSADNSTASVNGPRSIWLLNTTLQSADGITGALGENTGIACNIQIYPKLSEILSPPGAYSDDSGSIWSWVITGAVLLMAATLCIILNAFILEVDRRRQRLALMRTVGATRHQAQGVILAEAILMCGFGIPAGIILSVLLSYVVVQLFSVLSGIGLLYAFWPPTIPIAAFLSLATVMLASLVPIIKAGRVSPLAMVQNTPVRRHSSRARKEGILSPLHLSLYSMRRGWLRAIFTVLSFVVCIFMINLTALLGNHGLFELNQSSVPDYTVTTESSSYDFQDMVLYPMKEDPQPTGLSDAFRKALNVKATITRIDPLFYFTLDKEKIDKYIKLNPFTYEHGNQQASDEDMQKYGFLSGAQVTRLNISLVDSGALKQLTPYVAEGKIDANAILSGREILLSLPDYAVQTKQDGSTSIYVGDNLKDRPTNVPIISNTSYHIGDKITFTSLTSPSPNSEVTKKEKTVSVGAIIRRPSDLYGIGDSVGIVMGENVPDNWGFGYNISNTSVYLSKDSSIDKSEQIAQRLVNSYANVYLTSRAERIAIERQQDKEQMTIIAMLAICIGSLGFLGLLNTVSSRIYSRRREIAMLRAVGSTRGQVLRMLTYEGALYGLLSAVIGLLMFVLFMEFSPISIANWTRFVSVPLLGGSMLACILLGVLTVFLPAHKVMGGSIVEGVRMLN
jgi:ABC-type antimicrobial peptide transport system permease subunit